MKNKILFGFVFSVLVLSGFVSAFGVSSPYWEDHPMTIAAGEKRVVNFNLQNMVGDNTANVKIELVEGGEVVSLRKNSFTVDAGTALDVPLRVSVPRSADQGGVYEVQLEFRSGAVSNEGEMVSVGTGMSVSFDVIVDGEAPRPVGLYILIGVLVVGIIVFFFRKKDEKPKRKTKKRKSKK